MVASLSLAGQIATGLRTLQPPCSHRNLLEIARILGAPIATGSFSEALSGKRPFDRKTGDRLLEVVGRMRELSESVGLPLDWSRTEAIANALMTRLVVQIAGELHDPDIKKFEEFARRAEQEL